MPDAPTLEAQFEGLFQAHYTPILNYLYRLVGNGGVAEDLAQEAFTRAWKSRAQWPAIQNLRAWLYRIATNAAHDHMRRERLLSWLPLLGNEPGLLAPHSEEESFESERMRQALLKLKPEYRVPLVLFTCQELTVLEIADTLAISTDAVKQRLVRARQQLREAYR